jgi:TonB family protein
MQIERPNHPLRRRGAAPIGVALILCLVVAYSVPAAAPCEGCAEARALMDADNCKEAVKILRKEAKGDDASAEAVGLLAICRARLGKAKDAAQRVIEFLKLESRPAKVIEVTDEVASHVGKETAEFISFELDEGVVPPRLLVQAPPSYPQAAAEMGLTADIIVDAEVDREGRPRELTVRELEDSVALDEAGFHEAALNAVQLWRFIPALSNGVPVPARMTATVQFQVGSE